MDFQDKVAVVTGAANGIGAATARLFLREGARVALLDLDPGGAAVAAEGGDRAFFQQADLGRGDAVAAAFAAIEARFGGVDYLVNSAGIQRYGSVTETTEALWDEVMGANLKSAFLCAHHAVALMEARGGGVVVNVSSVQAFISQQRVAAYTTSKTAMLGLTRSIAVDYAPRVRCVAVCPGSVDTPLLRWGAAQSPDPEAVMGEIRAMHPMGRIAQPEEIADLIAYLCSDRAGFITGQAFRIDGGLGLSIPGSIRK